MIQSKLGARGARLFALATLPALCTTQIARGAPTARIAQDAPFVDGVTATQGKGLPREAPRNAALGIPDLYPALFRTQTPALDVARLAAEDELAVDPGPLRMGVVSDFAPVDGVRGGLWTPIYDGSEGWLWTASFRAPGARAMRLRLSGWNPPAGAELTLFDAAEPTETFGPFTGELQRSSGTFWTPTLYAEEVCVEYFLPPPLDPKDPANHIVVDALLNQYRAIGAPSPTGGPTAGELPCHLDVTCYPTWNDRGSGVGTLSVITNPYGFFCSGALLNRIPSDFDPLFMTARHCGVTEANAETVLVTWLYATSNCNGTPPSPSSLPQTLAQGLLVDDANTDYSLVGLSNTHVNQQYLGWDANYFPDGSFSAGIHHPAGSYQRITFGVKTDDVTSCVGGQSYFVTISDGSGEIEPGSSGGPLFDGDGRVRGTGSCASWGCNQADAATYGRFDVAYPGMAPYLNPVNPVYVNGAGAGNDQGTSTNPFDRLVEGSFAVIAGSNLYVTAGTYNESFSIDRAMTLRSIGGTVVVR